MSTVLNKRTSSRRRRGQDRQTRVRLTHRENGICLRVWLWGVCGERHAKQLRSALTDTLAWVGSHIVNAPDFTDILYSFTPYGVRTHVRRFCIINDSVRHTKANVAESERGKVAP